MKKGGVGGGNTKTGLNFEGKVDFLTFIEKQNGYSVDGNDVLYNGEKVAKSLNKVCINIWKRKG